MGNDGKGGNDSKGEDRRQYHRVPLSLLIQYRFDTLEDFLAEYATNISIGGMFIGTDHPREEGSLIYLQFYLRDGAKLIEGLGKVVRVVAPDDSDEPGMGIEFINFSSESMNLVEQIVRKQLSNDQ